MFVIGKPFQPSLMIVRKAGAYLSETPFRHSTQRQAPAVPTNNRLGWKAFYSSLLQKFVTYGCKKFYNIGPWRAAYIILAKKIVCFCCLIMMQLQSN